LSDKLHALLRSVESPIVGPDTAAKLLAFSAAPEPSLAEMPQVDSMIVKLALAPAQAKLSKVEANERLELYWLALKHIPLLDLRSAFEQLLKSSKFLPTPAEVHAAAWLAGAPRRHAKSRAKHLAWKHSVEWRSPVEPITPEEAREVRALLAPLSDLSQRDDN
jgi:hypothetical protein